MILPEYIFDLLKRHKVEQAKRRLQAGPVWKNADLVFTNQTGGYDPGTNMNGKLKRLIAGTDWPQDLHLHFLRHTHASLLIQSNVAARVTG